MNDIEVFRMTEHHFDRNKKYAFALATRIEGQWPYEKYFTSEPLRPVGQFIGAKFWGYGDKTNGEFHFILDDKQTCIRLDYAGRTCFIDMDSCLILQEVE